MADQSKKTSLLDTFKAMIDNTMKSIKSTAASHSSVQSYKSAVNDHVISTPYRATSSARSYKSAVNDSMISAKYKT